MQKAAQQKAQVLNQGLQKLADSSKAGGVLFKLISVILHTGLQGDHAILKADQTVLNTAQMTPEQGHVTAQGCKANLNRHSLGSCGRRLRGLEIHLPAPRAGVHEP